ncbi:MAG: helix-turn-helix domain-containing protein [Candidatus Hodarchaeota archaeon]
MSVFSDQQMLQEIGLSETEGKVYAALVTNYFRTLEEVLAYSDLSKEEVSSALEALEGKKFVRKIVGKVNLYIAINPHLTVTSEAEKRLETDLNAVSDSVKEIWQQTSTELQEKVVGYVGAVRNSTESYTNELNSQAAKIIEESEGAIRAVEQDIHKSLTKFTTETENKLTERLESTTGQFEKETIEFLKLVEDQTNILKNNLSGLESELTEVASINMRDKPTEAIIGYREGVQNQAISQIQESINQFGVLQDQVRELVQTATELVEQGKAGVEQAIQNMGGRSVEKFSQNIDRLDRTIAEIESKTTTLTSEFLSNLKETLSPLRENLKTILGESSKSTGTVVSQSSSSLMSSIDEVKGNVSKAITSSEESIKQTFGKMDAAVQESTAELLIETNKTLESSKEQLSGVKENAATSLESRFSKFEEERSSRTEETLTSMITVQEGLSQSLKDLEQLIIGTVHNVGTSAADGLEEAVSSVSSKIDHLRGMSREQLESLEAAGEMVIGQMQGSFGGTIDTFSQQISEKARKSTGTLISEELPKEKDTLKARLEEACSTAQTIISEITQIQEMFKETYQSETELKKSSLNKTVVSKTDATRDEVVSSIEKMYTSIDEEYTRLREKVPQDVELMVEDQRNRVMHINMDIRGALRELFTPLSDLIREGPDATKKSLKKKEVFEEFYNTVKKGVEDAPQIEDKIENALNSNVEEFSKAVNDYLDFFSKTVQDSGQKIQGFTEETIAKTKEEASALKATIYSEIGSFIEASEAKITENSTQSLNETGKIVKSVVNDLSTISDTIGQTIDRLSSKLSDVTDFIGQLAKQSKESVSTQLNEFATTMRSAIRSIIDQSIEQIDSAIQELAARVESARHSQKEEMTERVTNAAKEVEKTFQGATESSNEVFEKMEGLVTKLQEQTSNSLKEAQSEITTNLEAILVSEEEEFGSALRTLLKLHEGVESKVDALKTSLGEAFREQQNELLGAIASVNKTVDEMFSQNKEKISAVTRDLANGIKDAQNAASSEIDREFSRFEENLVETTSRQAQISNEFGSMKSLIAERRETAIRGLEDSLKQSQEAQKTEMSLQLNTILKNLTNTFEGAQNTFSDQAAKLTKLRANLHKDIETITDSYKRELERFSEDLSAKAKQINRSFASTFGSAFLDLKGNTDSFISENKKNLQDEFSETISTLRTKAEDLENKALAPARGNVKQVSILATNASEKIPADLGALVADLDKETASLVQDLSERITKDIDGIPATMRAGLEKTGSVMKFIRAVHDIAISAPPNPIEHTYFVIGKEGIRGAMKGAMERTKTAINIITPALSSLPIETIKTLPKTRRVQILAGIDDMSIVKELSELGNVQLRELSGEEGAIGFFRDGEEEGAIGAGIGELGQMVITTDSNLVKTMNQLFADLWPRGKKM